MISGAIQNGKQVFILDIKGKDALVAIPHAYSSYVIAHGYTIDENKNISWGYGDYFNEISEACNKFYSKHESDYHEYIRRWRFVKNMNESDIYCYGEATSEDGNFKVYFDDDFQRMNYEKLFEGDK